MSGYPPMIAHKSGWLVHTSDETSRMASHMAQGAWLWSAWGPHGFQSGIEGDAEVAAAKARSASYVLSSEMEKKR